MDKLASSIENEEDQIFFIRFQHKMCARCQQLEAHELVKFNISLFLGNYFHAS